MSKALASGLLAGTFLILSAVPAYPIITFNQLDQNTFTVSHRVKGFGSRGKAMELVYTKGASLCVAAGYTHYQILDQESQASQQYEAANATLTLRFFLEGAADRIACQSGSDPEYIEEARAKLEKLGYRPPDPGQGSESINAVDLQEAPIVGTCPHSCTIEQIAGMARAGLSDDQIRAACEEASSQGAAESE